MADELRMAALQREVRAIVPRHGSLDRARHASESGAGSRRREGGELLRQRHHARLGRPEELPILRLVLLQLVVAGVLASRGRFILVRGAIGL